MTTMDCHILTAKEITPMTHLCFCSYLWGLCSSISNIPATVTLIATKSADGLQYVKDEIAKRRGGGGGGDGGDGGGGGGSGAA